MAFDDFDEDSPEFEAEMTARIQEMEDGFYYEQIESEIEGEWLMKCSKCGRTADFMKHEPFPHRADCEMKLRFKN